MSARIEVKICGITRFEDACSAMEQGADYLGFVFYARSPRGVKPLAVARILDQLDCPVRAVGVFVNETRSNMEAVIRDCRLHAIQLHGDEKRPEAEPFSVPVWKTIWWRTEWTPRLEDWQAERYVVDAAPPGVYGGSGEKGNWVESAKLARRFPVMLAGGLTPENVGEAIRQVHPQGVDVVSGIESEPGRKALDKMKKFIDVCRRCNDEPSA